MRHEEAEAQRQQLQRDDHEHTYFVRERPPGEWEVLRANIPHPASDVVAELGELPEVHDDPRPFIAQLIPPYGPGGF